MGEGATEGRVLVVALLLHVEAEVVVVVGVAVGSLLPMVADGVVVGVVG